jgi:hypothetical protein
MSYKITYSYNWYRTDNERFIIKTYHINSIPFTFDELPAIVQDDPEIIKMAEEQLTLSPEIFYQKAFFTFLQVTLIRLIVLVIRVIHSHNPSKHCNEHF